MRTRSFYGLLRMEKATFRPMPRVRAELQRFGESAAGVTQYRDAKSRR